MCALQSGRAHGAGAPAQPSPPLPVPPLGLLALVRGEKVRVLLERHQRFEVRDRIQHPSAVNCHTQDRRGEPRATAGGLPRGSGKACAPGCMKVLRLRAASASSHTTITLQSRLRESARWHEFRSTGGAYSRPACGSLTSLPSPSSISCPSSAFVGDLKLPWKYIDIPSKGRFRRPSFASRPFRGAPIALTSPSSSNGASGTHPPPEEAARCCRAHQS